MAATLCDVVGRGARKEEVTRINANATQMNANRQELNAISNRIFGCALTVVNTLGCRSLEKVYEDALAAELCMASLAVRVSRSSAAIKSL